MTNNEFVENEDFGEKVGNLVDKLVKIENNDEASKNKIIGLLQDINEEILKHKIIADQYTIYPIWVEAYYSNENFQDPSCHDRTNVLGQFMFRKHNIGRGGVDLYLGKPDKDYYLSFLIKLAIIQVGNQQPELCSQIAIKCRLNGYIDKDLEFIKYDLNRNHFEIVEDKRVGLREERCPDHYNLPLASYIEEVGKKRSYATLRKKEELYIELINNARV